MTYRQIQDEIIKKYNVTINTDSDCWGRMHAHPRQRKVCKWCQKNSVVATFDLLHEVGHIECYENWMRRCEDEYFATRWAIERCHEYGIEVPAKIRKVYQDYINMELDRGKRRGGQGYPSSLKLKW